MTRIPNLLILADEAAQIHRWARPLADQMRVWHAVADVPPDVVPEVIAVDATASAVVRPERESAMHRWQAAEIGVVAVGADPGADVPLPPDCTAREFQLACRLLAEAIHWRRECHRARQMQLAYSQLALTDALTGLPNRRAWDKEVEQRSAQALAVCGPIGLALFDVDHFKSINDRFGHIAGDEILCHVARGLARACRDSDFFARIGGDEFAVLLGGRSPADVAADVESIRTRACQGTPHTQVTACMGFAYACSLAGADLNSLFESADVALRVAKLSGRNRTVPAEDCPIRR